MTWLNQKYKAAFFCTQVNVNYVVPIFIAFGCTFVVRILTECNIIIRVRKCIFFGDCET